MPPASKRSGCLARKSEPVQKNARMFDAVPVEFPDRRTDAFRSAVAAVVVGQYGNVHAQGVECLGQSRRSGSRVTRIGSGFGKGGFEIDDRCIGRTEALRTQSKEALKSKSPSGVRAAVVGRMLHQVPGEDQPGTPYLREGWLEGMSISAVRLRCDSVWEQQT